LKHEYKQFGGNFEVLHHSELIGKIISEGKISLRPAAAPAKVTYHDSCYLGRYNDRYDDPRSAITAISGLTLTEMERNRSKGFCCGAGGGRMFLEDVEGTRINEERAREAIATGAGTVASACPFCMTMLQDGVKAQQEQSAIEIKDLAEIVWEQTV
jgi:Fe-S oxidoreductase